MKKKFCALDAGTGIVHIFERDVKGRSPERMENAVNDWCEEHGMSIGDVEWMVFDEVQNEIRNDKITLLSELWAAVENGNIEKKFFKLREQIHRLMFPLWNEQCECGHKKNQHLDTCGGAAKGHGACMVNGCKCRKFTWASIQKAIGTK
jgi:hypothetical protein